jgi:uncharacterized membrane protein YedE/YeeE
MLDKFHKKRNPQFLLGFLFGFGFGFLLQKGGVCHYETILNQLLLKDFTVIKIILTAVVTGMIGVYAMRGLGWIQLHKKAGSAGTSIPGPLIFGIGFALLGYCPGTAVGAVGHGALDALVGGVLGIMIGSALYTTVHAHLKRRVLNVGYFGDKTLIDALGVKNPWTVIIPVSVLIILSLFLLERKGF